MFQITFESFGLNLAPSALLGVPWALWDPAALGAGILLAVSSGVSCDCVSLCQLPKNGGGFKDLAGVYQLQPTL